MTDDIRHTLCHKSGQTKVQRWPNKVDLRAEWPLQGIQSEKVASGRCSPISTNHVALFGLSCTRLGLVSTLHLALAIFQQGAPCFGHRPFNFQGLKIMSDGSCDIYDLEFRQCRQTLLGDRKVFPRYLTCETCDHF